jgi:hypothetical protein
MLNVKRFFDRWNSWLMIGPFTVCYTGTYSKLLNLKLRNSSEVNPNGDNLLWYHSESDLMPSFPGSYVSGDSLPPDGSSGSSSRRSSSTIYPPGRRSRRLLTPLLNLPAPTPGPEGWTGPPTGRLLPDRSALSPFAIYTPGSALSVRSSLSSRSVVSEASTIFGPEKEHVLGERMRVIVDAFRTRARRVKQRLEQPPTPSADYSEVGWWALVIP